MRDLVVIAPDLKSATLALSMRAASTETHPLVKFLTAVLASLTTSVSSLPLWSIARAMAISSAASDDGSLAGPVAVVDTSA